MLHSYTLQETLLNIVEQSKNPCVLIGEAGHSVNPALPSLCEILSTSHFEDRDIVLFLEHIPAIGSSYDQKSLLNEFNNDNLNKKEFKIISYLLSQPNIKIFGLEQKEPFTDEMSLEELCQCYQKLGLPDIKNPQTQKMIQNLLEDGSVSDVKDFFNRRYADSVQRLTHFNNAAIKIIKETLADHPNHLFISVVGAKHIPSIHNTQGRLLERGMQKSSQKLFQDIYSLCIYAQNEIDYTPTDSHGNQYGSIPACYVEVESVNQFVSELPFPSAPTEEDENKDIMSSFVNSFRSFFSYLSSENTVNDKKFSDSKKESKMANDKPFAEDKNTGAKNISAAKNINRSKK